MVNINSTFLRNILYIIEEIFFLLYYFYSLLFNTNAKFIIRDIFSQYILIYFILYTKNIDVKIILI